MTTSDLNTPETRIVEMVFPNQANHYGTLFGGDALRLMDTAAFVAASRFARKPVVTASSQRIDFNVPVRQGQLAEVVGRVSRAGRTSVTVEVELWAEDLLTGARELCTKGSFILVAVDEHGHPVPIQGPTAQQMERKEAT
jgi:acyl-CoA hydrolase